MTLRTFQDRGFNGQGNRQLFRPGDTDTRFVVEKNIWFSDCFACRFVWFSFILMRVKHSWLIVSFLVHAKCLHIVSYRTKQSSVVLVQISELLLMIIIFIQN